MRDAAWGAVEYWLTATHTPVGTVTPVGVLIESRNGDQVASVEAEMRRAGIEMIKVVQQKRWLFGPKWQLMGRVPKLRMSRTDTDAWLDRIEASMAPYGATVVGWTALDPTPKERRT